MNKWNINPDIIPVSLLLVFGFAISATFIMVALIGLIVRRNRFDGGNSSADPFFNSDAMAAWITYRTRPTSWLAIKSRNLPAVQAAFGLQNGHLCSMPEGLGGNQRLFIAAPINGWILAAGSGLPDSSDDPDACFKLVTELSRALGQVQFFSACRISLHHAWVKAEHGAIVRGYAWAGTTVWRQGNKTYAEKELGMTCFDFSEPGDVFSSDEKNQLLLNVDKVPLLAARWSLDPAAIDETLYQQTFGIAA